MNKIDLEAITGPKQIKSINQFSAFSTSLDGFDDLVLRFFYYDPEQDESREGVTKTGRWISLGDPKDKVIEKYGEGECGDFEK